MYESKITLEQKRFAWSVVKQNLNIFRNAKTDGNAEHRYTGYLGEVVLADLLRIKRPDFKGFDNGIDFTFGEVKLDLKTQGRNYDFRQGYVCNLMASQALSDSYLNNLYLFASINKKKDIMQFIGWIRKDLALKQPYFKEETTRTRDDGTTFETRGDMFEIPFSALRPFEDPMTFQIKMGGVFLPLHSF